MPARKRKGKSVASSNSKRKRTNEKETKEEKWSDLDNPLFQGGVDPLQFLAQDTFLSILLLLKPFDIAHCMQVNSLIHPKKSSE
jgi:hypothetical protein